MTRHKKHRLYFILGTLFSVSISAGLVLTSFQDAVVYFYTPSELPLKSRDQLSRRLRLGGLVVKGSIDHKDTESVPSVTFRVSDGTSISTIHYEGILPDLFREGQGIVAEGFLENPSDPRSNFRAEVVLAKHDENYRPPEPEKRLDKSSRSDYQKTLLTP
tara:strand:+ start:4678 stop:5157 length:480 start_codon:yes stop_codon:yes gene_type:complete